MRKLQLLSLLFYFVVQTYAQSPGGVSTGLNMWLKANAGTNTVNHNEDILSWEDQSGERTNLAQRTSGIQLYRNNTGQSLNYNPCIWFNGLGGLTFGDDYIYTTAGNGGISLFSIVKPDVTVLKPLQWIYGFGHYADNGYGFVYSNNNYRIQTPIPASTPGFNHTFGVNSSLLNYNIQFGVGKNFNRNGNLLYNDNATPIALTATQLNQSPTAAGSAGPVSIGRQSKSGLFTDNNTRAYQGRIGEVIHYSSVLTANQIMRVNSYLAIKYGVTLSTNYLSSTSTLIFQTLAPYNNNIIGIGRDDNSALLQKQSKTELDSTRIYLSTLSPLNSTNTGVFSSDAQFVIIGDNNQSLSSLASMSDVPFGIGSRIDRVWKIQNTNFTGSFSVDIVLNNIANLGMIDPNDLRLLVDNDGVFGDASAYGVADGISISYNNPVITISGISPTVIPTNSTLFFTIGSINNLTTPLPISLLDFNVINKGNYAEVKWATASETNNDYFTIQRSKNGKEFEALENIQGAGNSAIVLNYSYKDFNPFTGVSYYRLKQTDYDGAYTYSEIKSIHIEAEFNAYPNPFSEQLTIESSISTKFLLIDKLNRVVRSIAVEEGLNSIKIEDLPSGVYLLKEVNSGNIIKLTRL